MSKASAVFGVFSLASWIFGQGDRWHARGGIADRLLAVATRQVQTQARYHASFTWDVSPGATGYAVLVKINGTEAWRVPTATNYATVSNLDYNLDLYQFSCVATNSAGESPESNLASLHRITVFESGLSAKGPWTRLATNEYWALEPQHWLMLSNWSAASLLKKD